MSHHCHDEHAGHGGHDHHEHDHSDDITPAIQHSLYDQINFDEITTLNESHRDAGKAVVKKTWAERLSVEPELASDADEQLLMTVPYVQFTNHSCFFTSDNLLYTTRLHNSMTCSLPYTTTSSYSITYSLLNQSQVHCSNQAPFYPPPHITLCLGAQDTTRLHQPRRPRLLGSRGHGADGGSGAVADGRCSGDPRQARPLCKSAAPVTLFRRQLWRR